MRGAWVILSSVRGLKTTGEQQNLAQKSLQRTNDKMSRKYMVESKGLSEPTDPLVSH